MKYDTNIDDFNVKGLDEIIDDWQYFEETFDYDIDELNLDWEYINGENYDTR